MSLSARYPIWDVSSALNVLETGSYGLLPHVIRVRAVLAAACRHKICVLRACESGAVAGSVARLSLVTQQITNQNTSPRKEKCSHHAIRDEARTLE